MPDATAGHNSLLAYDWEDTAGFLSAPSAADKKPFGIDATLSTHDLSNNAIRQFNPGSREAEAIIEQEFSGSFTVDFTLTNPWFLEAVLTTPTTSGTAPTTHTYDGETPSSMKIFTGNTNTATSRMLEGCVVQTATLTFNIPGTVDVSLDGVYAKENADAESFTQPPINDRALSFHDATLNRGGSALSFVQSLTVTINNNIDLIRELGDRFGVDFSPKQRNTTIDYARIVQDASDMERAYGGATTLQSKVENTADFTAVADNGKTGTSKNAVTLTMNGVFPDGVDRSGVGDATADLEDALSEMAPTILATAENDSASAR